MTIRGNYYVTQYSLQWECWGKWWGVCHCPLLCMWTWMAINRLISLATLADSLLDIQESLGTQCSIINPWRAVTSCFSNYIKPCALPYNMASGATLPSFGQLRIIHTFVIWRVIISLCNTYYIYILYAFSCPMCNVQKRHARVVYSGQFILHT